MTLGVAVLPDDLALVLVSFRGPVVFDRDEAGERTQTRGPGGLVTALSGVATAHAPTTWVCAASSPEDEVVAGEAGEQPVDADGIDVRLVALDHDASALAYGVIANPLLWFVQHGLWGHADAPVLTQEHHDAWERGYRPVNAAMADAVVAEVRRVAGPAGRALVMVQDYHLYLLPRLVRDACPAVVLTHFVHIPWPGPDAWRVLPPAWLEELLEGLLGADVVAFHTEGNARDFLLCVQELLGLVVDLEAMSVTVGERTVRSRHYPISIDTAALEAQAATPEVDALAQGLRATHLAGDRRLLLRVDRTDPSKNIVRGFAAFATLLEAHPEWLERVTFLALLQPSRTDVDEYGDYIRAIGAAAAEVNARHAVGTWQPVDLRFVSHLPLALAAYRVCDVLVVNALADGMNLVAKEACLLNERDMVLALSLGTGAHAELGAFAVTLTPFDIAQQAEALHEALSMPAQIRRDRLGAAAAVVRHNDVDAWLSAQIADLGLAAPPAGSGRA